MGVRIDNLSSIYGVGNTPSYSSSADTNTGSKTVGGSIVGGVQNGSHPSGTQSPVNQVTIFGGLEGTVFGQPVTHLFVWAAVGIGIYWFLHHHGKIEGDLAVPRVSLGSLFSITFQAIIGIVLLKTVLTKFRVPGLTEFVASA